MISLGVARLDVELRAVDEEDGRQQQQRERRQRRAGGRADRAGCPSPIPRKLAISRKLLKNPTYLTLAGIQRMSSSSTNSRVALVRSSRIGARRAARPRASGCRGSGSRASHGVAAYHPVPPRPTRPEGPVPSS